MATHPPLGHLSPTSFVARRHPPVRLVPILSLSFDPTTHDTRPLGVWHVGLSVPGVLSAVRRLVFSTEANRRESTLFPLPTLPCFPRLLFSVGCVCVMIPLPGVCYFGWTVRMADGGMMDGGLIDRRRRTERMVDERCTCGLGRITRGPSDGWDGRRRPVWSVGVATTPAWKRDIKRLGLRLRHLGTETGDGA